MSGEQHNTVLENKEKNLKNQFAAAWKEAENFGEALKKPKKISCSPTLSVDEQRKVLSRQHLRSSFSNHNPKEITT